MLKQTPARLVAHLPRVLNPLAALSAVLALSACSNIQPSPLLASESSPANQADRLAIHKDVEPITGPLSIEEAVARALKYNLDRRSKMMEEALALNQLDVTRFDMLPKLVAQAGYSGRSEERATFSSSYVDPVVGPKSTTSSVSQDRNRGTADLGLTWSLLDFGLGHYSANQQANRFLIASEKRRKAMHLLMQDVRTAYWRAAAGQLLRDEVAQTIALAEDALEDASKAEAERVRSPLEALRYQRQLLENLRLLEAISQELSSAQVELASLINAPVGTVIPLAEGDLKNIDDKVLKVAVGCMEEMALKQNPDLREQHYNTRIARDETRRTMTRLFPNLTFSYGLKYDADSYLVHQSWNEAGLQLSMNLMNLFTGPAQIKLAEAGVALSDQRRMATQLSVVTQVHLARLQVVNARSQYERADAIYSTDNKISVITRNRQSALSQSKLDVVSNNTAAILSLMRKYQALAQVQASENRLTAALGAEPAIASMDDLQLPVLTQQLRSYVAPWPAMLEKPDCRMPITTIAKQKISAELKTEVPVATPSTAPAIAINAPIQAQVKQFHISNFTFARTLFSNGPSGLLTFIESIRSANPDQKNLRIHVTGHADPIGLASKHQPLSQARAKAVVDFLRANGLADAKITSEGRGSSALLEKNCPNDASDSSKACHAPNRRVDIEVRTAVD